MRRLLILILLMLAWPVVSSEAQDVDREVLRWLRQKKPAIDSIVITGNHYFSDAQIRDQMYSRKRTFWHTLKGERRSRIQYIYLRNGFLEIHVSENFEPLPKGRDSTALIRVSVNEGRQFFYGPIKVTGSYDSRFNPRFYKITQRFRPGKPINFFDLRQAVFDGPCQRRLSLQPDKLFP